MLQKTKKTLEYYNYHELVDQIEEKYKIDIRDYSGWSAIMGDQHRRLQEAREAKYGLTDDEMRKQWSPADPRWAEIKVDDILREGELHYDTVGYKDYWHFLLEHLYDIHNGCIINIDFSDIREHAVEEDAKDGGVAWRTHITDLFIKEIGEGDNDYLIEW